MMKDLELGREPKRVLALSFEKGKALHSHAG